MDISGVPDFLGRWVPPLGMGAWLTPRNTLLPHVHYRTKFGAVGQTILA